MELFKTMTTIDNDKSSIGFFGSLLLIIIVMEILF